MGTLGKASYTTLEFLLLASMFMHIFSRLSLGEFHCIYWSSSGFCHAQFLVVHWNLVCTTSKTFNMSSRWKRRHA